MFVFGFIVAATLGCTAGSVDLTEGMFRHLVVTGRSRLALYLARIPAGLAIIVPLVAIGFTIVCAVCVFAAPTQLNYNGVNVPAGLSKPASRRGPPATPTRSSATSASTSVRIQTFCRWLTASPVEAATALRGSDPAQGRTRCAHPASSLQRSGRGRRPGRSPA